MDLCSIANDARVLHESVNISLIKLCNLADIKTRKCVSITLSPLQDRPPAQAGLGTFKDQKLKLFLILVDGNAPFFVVVLLIGGLA